MKKFVLAATVAATIAGSAFYATAERADNKEGMPPHKGGMMKGMDSDGNGTISKEEFLAEATKRFGEMDANSDGNVTQDEMEAHHKAMQAKHEEMKKEMDTKRDEHFKKMDANGDGNVSKEEMDAFHESNKDGPPKHGEEGGE